MNINQFPVPRIIKIDTEGAESLVINGGEKTIIPRNTDFIVCEWNGFASNMSNLRKKMLSKGYQTFLFDANDNFSIDVNKILKTYFDLISKLGGINFRNLSLVSNRNV